MVSIDSHLPPLTAAIEFLTFYFIDYRLSDCLESVTWMRAAINDYVDCMFENYYNRPPPMAISLPKSTLIENVVLQKFEELVNGPLKFYSTYKVIAGFVMVRDNNWNNLTVVSIGTGSKFMLKGNKWAGNIVDCHAEVVARRGFMMFLLKELNYTKQPDALFGEANNGKFFLKPNVNFYLYVSTAPCGDGRVFCHAPPTKKNNNKPAKVARAIGLLRRKGEEALTIKKDASKDGYKLETSSMSCSDKILKWNVVGVQGALVSRFLTEPIYLSGICLGEKFDAKHFERAIFGRIEHKLPRLPGAYKLNKPQTMQVQMTAATPVQYLHPFHSVNWHHGCSNAEVVDGVKGDVQVGLYQANNGKRYSQVSKMAVFQEYQQLYETKLGKLSCRVYKDAKTRSVLYQVSRAL